MESSWGRDESCRRAIGLGLYGNGCNDFSLSGFVGLDWTGLDWTGLDWIELGLSGAAVYLSFYIIHPSFFGVVCQSYGLRLYLAIAKS